MDTILLVDDDATICACLDEILTRSGYEVVTRNDARSALDIMEQDRKISLVIADYRMPGMNGLEMVRRLRERGPATPVVLLTGHEDLESYLFTQSLGNIQYIMKPVGAWELRKIVRNALAAASPQCC